MTTSLPGNSIQMSVASRLLPVLLTNLRYKSEVPTDLLNWLTELRETFYLLYFTRALVYCTQEQLDGRDAQGKVWERVWSFQCPLQVPLSHLHMSTNTEAL